jgi:DNA modification methylase
MVYTLYNADGIDWMVSQPSNSFEAIVTDPPYGLKEYTEKEKAKLRNGNRGGLWRLPPVLDGSERAPLPRFTVLSKQELSDLNRFFEVWGLNALRIAVPGAHLIIATNPFLSDLLYTSLRNAGWEKRGEIVRLVQTLKGGDRPKNAEAEFPDVSVMARSAWEPWGIFRKPLEGRVQDNLRKWKTGGLRRDSAERPFTDVILSERTPRKERDLVDHPSLKPQRFMRQVTFAALPLGEGRILDPFMGGGSTIAAAEAVGYTSVGIEVDQRYFELAKTAIPGLAELYGSAQISLGIQVGGKPEAAREDDEGEVDAMTDARENALRTLFG